MNFKLSQDLSADFVDSFLTVACMYTATIWFSMVFYTKIFTEYDMLMSAI